MMLIPRTQTEEEMPLMAAELENMREAMGLLKGKDARMTCAEVLVLLDAATNPDSSVTEIAERLGMDLPVVSRIVKGFVKPHPKDIKHDKPKNWWLTHEFKNDNRGKAVNLTTAGKAFVAQLKEAFRN